MLWELVRLLAASEPLTPQASEMERLLINEMLNCAVRFVSRYGSTKRLEVCSGGYRGMCSQGTGCATWGEVPGPLRPAFGSRPSAPRLVLRLQSPKQLRVPQAWALCLGSR